MSLHQLEAVEEDGDFEQVVVDGYLAPVDVVAATENEKGIFKKIICKERI